ncbi:MAG: DUF499 domain-containing protein, partial [Bdellovibrionales bacterium]|nr:DUF499 domain-containing protein [Bdellovibrionales bacterium]
MALSNKERVGRALDLLERGLYPFVEIQFKNEYGDDWEEKAKDSVREFRKRQQGEKLWDVQALLSLMWNNWNSIFSKILSRNDRSLVNELRDIRNAWAHQGAFILDDAYRALDSVERLLKAVSASEAQEVGASKREILRLRYEEEAKRELKSAVSSGIEGTPLGNLTGWREVITPHEDVRKGSFQQAEFAADLWAVHTETATEEYGDPREFFRRTFPTEGLKQLLSNALIRLSGKGGDPVVELQTNFGGGKTHSMLALYHMFSGVDLGTLKDIEPVLKKAQIDRAPAVKRAVFVGSVFSPASVSKKDDGTVVHTVWGEIGWQLGQYELVAESDKSGISPGREVLQKVFENAGPCLILIDEWVVHVRQCNRKSEVALPGGALESHFSFAQELTEAVTRVPHALLVASIPASDIEVGGSRGKEVLESLKNVFKRVAVAWRPASTDEGFEIVRRRLFEPLPEDTRAARDAVVRAFSSFYGKQSGEFPPECKEADYKRRLEASYPIHPELFDQLYNVWSTLDKFQRTRGVLRLMAAVIHTLWVRNDESLMILPAMVPIDESAVKKELLGYLEHTW